MLFFRGSKDMMAWMPVLLVLIPLKHREINNPAEPEIIFLNKLQPSCSLYPDFGQYLICAFFLVSHKKQNGAFFCLCLLKQLFLQFCIEKFYNIAFKALIGNSHPC